MITDNLHLMSRFDQDQDVSSKRCSSELSDSDKQCGSHEKLSSNILTVKLVAIFVSRMGRKEPQTLVGESWARFMEIWSCGKSASYYVECWNGEARLYFSTLLGRPEDLNKMADSAESTLFPTTTKVNSPKKQSPSKLKRNQLRLQAFLAKKRRESSDEATEPESVNGQVQPDKKVRQEPCSDSSNIDFNSCSNKSQEPCSTFAESTQRKMFAVHRSGNSSLLISIS